MFKIPKSDYNRHYYPHTTPSPSPLVPTPPMVRGQTFMLDVLKHQKQETAGESIYLPDAGAAAAAEGVINIAAATVSLFSLPG